MKNGIRRVSFALAAAVALLLPTAAWAADKVAVCCGAGSCPLGCC